MRLRSWGVLITALFTATTAMANAGYPPRTGGNYDGPRWYGYFANGHNADSYVPKNFDHTNMTEIWSTPLLQPPYDATARASQLQVATKIITDQLAVAAQYGEKAMVDVGAIVFIPIDSGNCQYSGTDYQNNPNAVADFQSLVQTLVSAGYLVPNDPESGTVSSFYIADEPDARCLDDVVNGGLVPNPALLNAISAIRQNRDTTNFPLATIVTKDYYSNMPVGLGLFDWVGMDDYHYGVTDYLNDFSGFEGSLNSWDLVGGTPQHFFLVPLVSNIGSSFSDPYYYGAASLYNQFVADGKVIGIMPFKWSADTDANGMNALSWWAPRYIALGNSIVHPPKSGVTLTPSASNSGSFALSWAADATATYYQVYQSAPDGGAPWTSTNVSGTSYTATNLANGSYGFYVLNCDASSCTTSSNARVVNGTVNISAPAGLSLSPATSRSGSFTLSWNSSWNGPYTLEQYRIFQSFNGGSWTWASTVNNTTSHVFTDLAPGTYTYYVMACNQGSAGWSDCSGASGKITETVVLSGPSGLTFSPSGTSTTGSFTLSWNSTWNGPYPFEQYHIYQSSNGGASWTWVYTINNTTSKAISGLGNGTYTYKIQACNYTACGYFSGTASETVNTGGGGGGIGGGCPPPPYQCQLVMPDDYAALRGDQATPGRLALAKQHVEAMAGAASLRAERAQRAPALILPGEEVAWQQRRRAAPELASATGVHRLPSDAQLARRALR